MNIIDKYAPTTLDDIVFVDEQDEYFIKRFVAGKHHIDNLLFYGPRGTQKTMTANIIAREIAGNDGLLIDEKLDEFLKRGTDINDYLHRTKLFFADCNSPHQRCVLVVHEIDTHKNLEKLWTVMDDNKDKLMLIATTNEPMKINESLRSRCMMCNFEIVNHTQFLPRAKHILASEKLTLNDTDILACLKSFCTDVYSIRSQMRVLQQMITMHHDGHLQTAIVNARRAQMKIKK
jgi:replication-associated recombination protein RarA